METNRRQVTFAITPEESGMRLDRVLTLRFPGYQRTLWQQRIRQGEVTLDSRATKASHRVKSGQQVGFSFTPRAEPQVDTNFTLLHEDESLLVINKPPNLPVHPAGVYFQNTLHTLLKERYGPGFVSYFVHRLDRETSGVLLLARNRPAAAALNRAFRDNRVEKEYRVLVENEFPAKLEATGWLLPDEKSAVKKKRRFILDKSASPGATPPGDNAHWCKTNFTSLGSNGELSFLRADLFTGRLHQIRATLQSLGFPVVGDRLYGVDDELYLKFINDTESDDDRRRLRMNRTALHCFRLSFPHPARDELIEITAPLPDDIAVHLAQL